jgi:hypothetical protein
MKNAARKKTEKRTISMPRQLLRDALERSASEHRSLSSYIQILIARDAEKARENEQISSPA